MSDGYDIITANDLVNSISWAYYGIDKSYRVSMRGAGVVFTTTVERERDLFIAELKARILLASPAYIIEIKSEATP